LNRRSAVADQYSPRTSEVGAHTLARQCQGVLDELTFLAPWLLLPAAPAGCGAGLGDFPGIGEDPTLRELDKIRGDSYCRQSRAGSMRVAARGKRMAG